MSAIVDDDVDETMVDIHTECPICCENYRTTGKLTKITCGCGYSVCRGCIEDYIIESPDTPHCMECRRGWTHATLRSWMTRSFMNKAYKTRRKAKLMDAERTRFPETAASDAMAHVQAGCTIEHAVYQTRVYPTPKASKRASFIHACPVDDCRGYLNENSQCSLCGASCCPKCVVVLPDVDATNSNTNTITKAHKCDPQVIKSLQMMQKECRNCPSCRIPIYRVSGCDQMWCTQCQVAFSWATGQRITRGVIHNPHYFQAKRQGLLRPAEDAPMQELGACDAGARLEARMLHASTFYSRVYYHILPIYQRRLRNIARLLQNYANREVDNLDLRIRYLLGRIDENELKKRLMAREIAQTKRDERAQIYEIGRDMLIDAITAFTRAQTKVALFTMIEQVERARQFCNSQIIDMCQSYGAKNTGVLSKDWKSTRFSNMDAIPGFSPYTDQRIAYVPLNDITSEEWETMRPKSVPDEFQTYEVCLDQIHNDANCLPFIAPRHRSEEICTYAIHASHSRAVLDAIPSSIRTPQWYHDTVTSKRWFTFRKDLIHEWLKLDYIPQNHTTNALHAACDYAPKMLFASFQSYMTNAYKLLPLVDEEGNTPLMVALESRTAQSYSLAIKMLRHYPNDCRVDAVNRYGKTVSDYL